MKIDKNQKNLDFLQSKNHM
nr:hypothetical protein [Sicyoidochytrium minutum DNA virus]